MFVNFISSVGLGWTANTLEMDIIRTSNTRWAVGEGPLIDGVFLHCNIISGVIHALNWTKSNVIYFLAPYFKCTYATPTEHLAPSRVSSWCGVLWARFSVGPLVELGINIRALESSTTQSIYRSTVFCKVPTRFLSGLYKSLSTICRETEQSINPSLSQAFHQDNPLLSYRTSAWQELWQLGSNDENAAYTMKFVSALEGQDKAEHSIVWKAYSSRRKCVLLENYWRSNV